MLKVKTTLYRVGGVLLIASGTLMFLNALYFLWEEEILNLIGINLEYLLFWVFCISSLLGYSIKVVCLLDNLSSIPKEDIRYKLKTWLGTNSIIAYSLMMLTIGIVVISTFVLKTNILRSLYHFTWCIITLFNILGGKELYGSK